jgi:hypothetical protein
MGIELIPESIINKKKRQQVCGFLLRLCSVRIRKLIGRNHSNQMARNNMQISRDDFHKQRFRTMPIRARLDDNKRLNQFIKTLNHKISSRFGLVQGQLTFFST